MSTGSCSAEASEKIKGIKCYPLFGTSDGRARTIPTLIAFNISTTIASSHYQKHFRAAFAEDLLSSKTSSLEHNKADQMTLFTMPIRSRSKLEIILFTNPGPDPFYCSLLFKITAVVILNRSLPGTNLCAFSSILRDFCSTGFIGVLFGNFFQALVFGFCSASKLLQKPHFLQVL